MRAFIRSAVPLILVLSTACGDGGTATETPRAVVTTGPTSLELIPGGSKYIVYSVERIAGHSGAVNLTVTGVPEGVLARFHPPVVTNAALVSSLEVTVSPTASSGTYTFNTVATGSGVQSTSIPVTVTIVVPGVSLTASQGALSLEQGKSASTRVNVARSGSYSGVVGLTLSGLPPGVTASLSAVALQGGETEATLTTTAALDAPVGNFAITVTATSPGVATRSITIPVAVTTGTTPAVLLSASPSALAIIRGTTVPITLHVARFAGYSDAVSIAVDGLPPPVTAAVAPVAAGQSTTTLLVTAGEDAAAPAVTTLMLRATGAGIQDATLPLPLSVSEQPTFRFNFTQNGQNSPPVRALGAEVARGSSVFVGGAIDRVSGFSEAVTVSVIGMPPGVTMARFTVLPEDNETLLPIVLPASSAAFQPMALVVRAAANETPGLYNAVLRGVASGGLTVEALVSIRVY